MTVRTRYECQTCTTSKLLPIDLMATGDYRILTGCDRCETRTWHEAAYSRAAAELKGWV